MKSYPDNRPELLERIEEMLRETPGNVEWFYYSNDDDTKLFGPPDPSAPRTLVLQFNGGQFDVNSMLKHIKDLVDERHRLFETVKVYKGAFEKIQVEVDK